MFLLSALAIMIGVLNGATSFTPPQVLPSEAGVFMEFTAPQCPSMEDEPCYVIIYKDLLIEVGP